MPFWGNKKYEQACFAQAFKSLWQEMVSSAAPECESLGQKVRELQKKLDEGDLAAEDCPAVMDCLEEIFRIALRPGCLAASMREAMCDLASILPIYAPCLFDPSLRDRVIRLRTMVM